MKVINNKVLTIDAYLRLIGFSELVIAYDVNKPSNVLELRDYLDHNDYDSLWDFPLNEIEETLESDEDGITLVTDGKEYRWFELTNEATEKITRDMEDK